MTGRKHRIGLTLTELVVVLVVVVLLIALTLPAVQQAREAARRTQSKNNLKQIGLALHNYHDVFGTFPPGGIFNAEGTAFHGWTTGIAPYLDCSPFYNSINFNYPWDDPQQVEKFITNVHPVFINPSVEPTKSPDGIPLVHYSANQWLFHRNSSTRIKDIETGTSNTLAMADAYGHFAPLGYPYNWRDPLIPINTSPDGFGYHQTGMHALLMDGSVKWINKDMANEIHASFAGPEKLKSTAEQVEKPAGEFRLGEKKAWTTVELFRDQERKVFISGRKNPYGDLVEIQFHSMEKNPKGIIKTCDDALQALMDHKSLRKVSAENFLSDSGLQSLARFENITSLAIGGQWITDTGAAHLAEMPLLTALTLDQTKITAKGLMELGRLPKLSTLEIIEPDFGDEGIRALLHLIELNQLEFAWYIRPVKVTPAGLVDLFIQRPELRVKVRVHGTTFQNQGVRELFEAERDWTGRLLADPDERFPELE